MLRTNAANAANTAPLFHLLLVLLVLVLVLVLFLYFFTPAAFSCAVVQLLVVHLGQRG
jgi:hypothetical protein